MTMEKTRNFYRAFNDICNCAYCRNYIKEVRKAYPNLAEYLNKLGVDIEKPFETMPGEPESGFIEYFSVQYIVIGDKEDLSKTKIGGIAIDITKSFPDPGLDCKYYVVEVGPIKLEWTIEGKL